MNERKRKIGRPMKYGEDTRVGLHISLSQDDKTKIKLSGKNASYFLEFGLHALLGDPDEKKLVEINEKLASIEPEYLELKAQKIRIEEKIRQEKEFRLKKENQDRYMHSAFSEVVRSQEKHGRIVVNMAWVEEAYGISFNLDLVNRKFNEVIRDLPLPSEYVLQKYQVIKTSKGQREERIMVRITEKEGDL